MSKIAVSADYSLNPEQMAQAVKFLIAADVPGMIWGPPGVGKSAVMKQVAADLNMHYIDIRALMLDPVDLRGIPYRDGERTRWAPPAFIPPSDSQEAFLLNLEELPSAPPLTQASLYQLALDRCIGETRLPPGARIIACGNRAEDRAPVHRMPAPLASRFIHLDASIDFQAWMDWALAVGPKAQPTQGPAPAPQQRLGGAKLLSTGNGQFSVEVIFFLRYQQDLLSTFDPKSKEVAFACPRTWEFVSQLVSCGVKGADAVEAALLRGAVGEGPAVQFLAFLEVFAELPAPEQVFTDPDGVEIPTKVDATLALCATLCKMVDDTRMDALVRFAKRPDMRPEISADLVNMSTKYNPRCRYTRAFMEWESHLNKLAA